MSPIHLRDSGHPKAAKPSIAECKASGTARISLAKAVSGCPITQGKPETAAEAKNFCPADYIDARQGEKMYKGDYTNMLKSTKAWAKVSMRQAIAACQRHRDARIAVCGLERSQRETHAHSRGVSFALASPERAGRPRKFNQAG